VGFVFSDYNKTIFFFENEGVTKYVSVSSTDDNRSKRFLVLRLIVLATKCDIIYQMRILPLGK